MDLSGRSESLEILPKPLFALHFNWRRRTLKAKINTKQKQLLGIFWDCKWNTTVQGHLDSLSNYSNKSCFRTGLLVDHQLYRTAPCSSIYYHYLKENMKRYFSPQMLEKWNCQSHNLRGCLYYRLNKTHSLWKCTALINSDCDIFTPFLLCFHLSLSVSQSRFRLKVVTGMGEITLTEQAHVLGH